jgi:two-component system nitrogen regulation response regulator GlnG
VRIVAATHRDLQQLIGQGLFREDLFFRLNVVPIRLPALRERADDIPDLLNHFLKECERQGLPAKTFSADAVEALRKARWRGNVRELENFVNRLCAIHIGDEITGKPLSRSLPARMHRSSRPRRRLPRRCRSLSKTTCHDTLPASSPDYRLKGCITASFNKWKCR